MPLLIIWLFINVVSLTVFVHMAKNSEECSDVFIYPKIDSWLEQEEIGRFGKSFVKGLFTIIFLPSIVVYFTVLFTFSFVAIILVLMFDGLVNMLKK